MTNDFLAETRVRAGSTLNNDGETVPQGCLMFRVSIFSEPLWWRHPGSLLHTWLMTIYGSAVRIVFRDILSKSINWVWDIDGRKHNAVES